MTTHPVPAQAPGEGLRVLKGRSLRRPSIAPWMVMVLIGVLAFLGLGFARTSLDRAAFELAQLDRAIQGQEALNQQLRLEIARLESPARIAPLAEGLGLVIPDDTNQLLVDLDSLPPLVAGSAGEGQSQ